MLGELELWIEALGSFLLLTDSSSPKQSTFAFLLLPLLSWKFRLEQSALTQILYLVMPDKLHNARGLDEWLLLDEIGRLVNCSDPLTEKYHRAFAIAAMH